MGPDWHPRLNRVSPFAGVTEPQEEFTKIAATPNKSASVHGEASDIGAAIAAPPNSGVRTAGGHIQAVGWDKGA